MRALVTLLAALLLAPPQLALPAGAQTPTTPAIEAVSIKRAPDNVNASSFGSRPGGGVVTVNMTMESLINLAYELPGGFSSIEKAPDWFFREGYDVNAVVSGKPTPEQSRELWRAVFAERFKLKAHVETRDVPAYAVVLARPDQPLPPGLKRIAADCGAIRDARQRGETLPAPPLTSTGAPPCGGRYSNGMVVSTGMTIANFARSIQAGTGRVLIDKTGLHGDYEFTLTYSSPRPGTTDTATLGDDRPSIFTALQEQLGLKLEPARTQVEFLVIDHIDRPTAD